MQQWQMLKDHPNQRIRFERLNEGFYRIRARHSGKVLDVVQGSSGNGARVIQWDATGGPNQQWKHTIPFD